MNDFSSRKCLTRSQASHILASWILLLTLLPGRPVTLASEPVVRSRTSVLHLTNGDHVSGTLVQATSPDCLGWKSPSFASPFQFSLSGLASVHFSTLAEPPKCEGEYGFQLATGDLLYGSLIGLNDQSIQMDISGLGRFDIDRSAVQRMYRRSGGESDLLFVGPNGLAGWSNSGDAGPWREDAGHLTSDKPGAVLFRNFNLPNRVRIEFELTWTGRPDFELAVGVDDAAKTVSRAFRFDVWENELVVQRETEREANVERLQEITDKSGRIHVVAFLDQLKGRMLVHSPGGERLADLAVTTGKPQVYGGLQLTNRRGDIRLERLQIGQWNGETPKTADVGKARVHLTDGSIIYGSLKLFDAAKREFTFANDTDTQVIPEERIEDVLFAQSDESPPQSVRLVFLTGMKLTGHLTGVEGDRVQLKSPGFAEPIPVSLEALQTIVILKSNTPQPELPGREGRLEIDGTAISGCMVDSQTGEPGCLVWMPIDSMTSSTLLPGVPARVIYEAPRKKAAPVVQQKRAAVRALAPPQRAVRKVISKQTPGKGGFVLHLRTGDRIPLSEASIDETGLSFKSSISESTFVPHEKIHALELLPDEESQMIDPRKHERLLTLPRMQRNNPPTHLLRSTDGDYLRGRLVSMNDAQITVELRLEGKIVRRDRVAIIVWLHPESLNSQADETKKPVDNEITRSIQAVLHGSMATAGIGSTDEGNRLTFTPERVEGSILTGKSELFGNCSVDLRQVDQLYVGSAIEMAAADLPYGSWKLKPATDPIAPKEPGADSEDSGGEGQESALVGKAAPEINLKTLDGTEFRLSERKDKVVILDFWASWCGPCLQVMPQIDQIAADFAEQGVELYAVNLEETPEKIKAALERLKLSPIVLLDRDGRVAQQYGASAIPQTVIIDREGKVARLFVGGGSRFDERLRTALKSVLTGDAPTKSP